MISSRLCVAAASLPLKLPRFSAPAGSPFLLFSQFLTSSHTWLNIAIPPAVLNQGVAPPPAFPPPYQALAASRVAGECPDTLLVLQHPPVFTVGKRGQVRAHHPRPEVQLLGGIPSV